MPFNFLRYNSVENKKIKGDKIMTYKYKSVLMMKN